MRCTWILLIVVVLVVWCGEEATAAKKVPRWWLKVAQRQGPNACVVEEIPGNSKEFWTECKYWLKRKICGKKTRIRFECCEGYGQIDGENGCTLVKPLKNLLQTAESLGATDWAAYIRESGLEHELESAGAYTLFAPTNQAFQEMKGNLRDQMESFRNQPQNPILLYHLAPSKLPSDQFEGDQTIETRYPGHHIRINKYSNGMTTINCALLVRKDQEATNGLVHVIDRVLDPAEGISNNLVDVILKDGRFLVMSEILEKSGYSNVLRTMQDSITILAPSDEAFQKIPESRREKIINDREARLALLQNHVIPHVICESAITGEHRVRTMSNNKLEFDCDIDGTYVEDTKMLDTFNLGQNGILHMIDDVLLPDRAKNLVELAESRNLETFVDLVKRSGLEDTLSHNGDYTFFVPDENAWLEMPPEALSEARRNPEYAGLMLRFHGAYGRHLTNGITDNQGIMSLDEKNPVRLQVWRRALGVEDAKITESDIEAQNGVIHIVNKVIFPSNKSVEDTLASIQEHTFFSFTDLMNTANAQNPPTLNVRPGDDMYYTFFAPTDEAFDEYNQEDLREARNNGDEASEVVKSHVAVNMFPETSFEPGLIYILEGIGREFKVRKTPDGELTVNGGNVLSSHMSSNGVIHVVDKVFKPSDGGTYSTVKKTSISTVTSRHGGSSTSTHTYTSRKTSSGRSQHASSTFNEGLDNVLPGFSQDDGRTNYIGHHYGDDVVGHTSDRDPLPFTARRSSYSNRTITSDQGDAIPIPYVIRGDGKRIHGRTHSQTMRTALRTAKNSPSPVFHRNTL